MEAACLRIKFTPLLQDLQQDSNHCLEIVPEITNVENLDKIQWKNEENYKEYTVPITYKIIISKKIITNKEDLDKTYYSCVDLLLHSFDTGVDLPRLESGDIKRVLSDSFILYNFTQGTDKCSSIILKNPTHEHGNVEQKLAEVQTEIDDTSSAQKLSIVESLKCFDEESNDAEVQTDQSVLPYKIDGIQKMEADDQCGKKIAVDQLTGDKTQDENQFKLDRIPLKHNNSQFANVKFKIDAKHSLSWTPIYSMNTDDNIIKDNNIVESNPFLYFEKSSLVNKKKMDEIDYYQNLLRNDYYLNYDIFNLNTALYKPTQQFDCAPYRVLPEVRIAKIVQQMEREIKPLKIILNDIISKCSTLGYFKKKFQKEIGNQVNSEKEINKSSNMMNKAKSNRVVYSIVFDG